MQLLLIRHAIAMEREEFAPAGLPDSERPLTPEGKAKMIEVAKGLMRQVDDLALLASSPYLRARQTADIVAAAFPGVRRAETPVLIPDEPPLAFARWLAAHAALTDDGAVIAAVGHEPHLGDLAEWLIAGDAEGAIVFKKGGAALIEFDDAPLKGSGVLRWLLEPGQLRKMA